MLPHTSSTQSFLQQLSLPPIHASTQALGHYWLLPEPAKRRGFLAVLTGKVSQSRPYCKYRSIRYRNTLPHRSICRLAFAVTFVTFFATIWDKGIVFNWMLNLTGISALLVWGSIGVISIRFRMAYRAQNRDLADLPFRQPFYPLLPISILVLATLMFLVEGYVVIATTPFQFTVSLVLFSLRTTSQTIVRCAEVFRNLYWGARFCWTIYRPHLL